MVWQFLIKLTAISMWPSNGSLGHLFLRNETLGRHKNLYNKLWYICIIKYTKQSKRTNSWYRQCLGWISRKLCWVKKVKPRTLYMVWVHLCNLYKWQNFRNREQFSGRQSLGRQGWERKEGEIIKEQCMAMFDILTESVSTCAYTCDENA